MNPIALSAALATPALWALRHKQSPAVKAWAPPQLPGDQYGELYARAGGDGNTAVVLLHGLVSTGDVFGEAYDELAQENRLVVPDLLGFGRSMNRSRESFSPEEHLEALDELAARTGLFERRWTLGAHSMGSALALRWAARHCDRVDRVVCWGAPIYPTPGDARDQISGGAMTRLFALDTKWAERACAISCSHRTAAGWLTAMAEPDLPVPVARAVSQHTWPAYRDAMCGLVIDTDWPDLLGQLAGSGTNTELVWGSNDRVGDVNYAASIAGTAQSITVVPDADHHLPMTHPELCRLAISGPRPRV